MYFRPLPTQFRVIELFAWRWAWRRFGLTRLDDIEQGGTEGGLLGLELVEQFSGQVLLEQGLGVGGLELLEARLEFLQYGGVDHAAGFPAGEKGGDLTRGDRASTGHACLMRVAMTKEGVDSVCGRSGLAAPVCALFSEKSEPAGFGSRSVGALN